MANETTLTRYRGTYSSTDKAEAVLTSTGKAGDFVVVNGTIYVWDTSTKKLSTSTDSSHYKGTFNNIYEVQEAYPNGGVEGDYVNICGFAHYWNADRNTWVVTERRDEYIDELLTAMSSKIGEVETLQATLEKLMAAGYVFGGIVTPTTGAPGVGDYKIYFLASEAGTYKNFGDKTVDEGEVALLKWDGKEWDREVTDLAKKSSVSALDEAVAALTKEVDELEKSVELKGLNATFAASETLVDANNIRSTTSPVMLTWSLTDADGEEVEMPDTFTITQDGKECVGLDGYSAKGHAISVDSAGTYTYVLEATVGKRSVKAEVTVTVVYPCYIGAHLKDDAADVDIKDLQTSVLTEQLQGSFSINRMTDAGKVFLTMWIWIAVPQPMTINGVELDGISVPLQTPSVKDGYNLYRFSNHLQGDTYKIVIK